jgi:SH3-like domain-containing protein
MVWGAGGAGQKVVEVAFRFRLNVGLAALVLGGLLGSTSVQAQAAQVGASGLPLPRYVSIKSSKVNIRVGPSLDHGVAWTFVKAGVPVEVTQEFDIWYHIRDSEGQEGWVQKTFLSGQRTAFVAPKNKAETVPMRSKPESTIASAMLEAGALVTVNSCDGKWCRIVVDGYKGYVDQTKLWGVYPDEKVD